MKRDGVAPKRKAKIPIPVAQMNWDLRQAAQNSNLKSEGSRHRGFEGKTALPRLLRQSPMPSPATPRD